MTGGKMSQQITLKDLLKRNPHLDPKEIERIRQLAEVASREVHKRTTIPDRLSIGDASRTRKVRLR